MVPALLSAIPITTISTSNLCFASNCRRKSGKTGSAAKLKHSFTMKTETKHTPGPWHVADNGVFSEHLNGHGNFYVVALPFPKEEPTEQDKANLNLIAAAPDLLAACILAAAIMPSGTPRQNEALKALCNAIARATGQ